MEPHQKRLQMVERQLLPRGIRDERVLQAMGRIPREKFLPASLQHIAYQDSPIPIGEDQTISQPYIVALMTQSLELQGGERLLEIGTGSGYQTALLAELAAEVFTVERIANLSRQARAALESLGYTNVSFRVADGSRGWPEEAPFEAILVTAAAPDIIRPLREQLAEGGKMVIPVGSRQTQHLLRLTRREGRFDREELGGCVFVPLVGRYGYHPS